MSAEARNLEVIAKAIDHHNTVCEFPATAVLMSPFEVERLGWDSIKGVPVRPAPGMGTGSFQIVCDKGEGGLEEEEAVEAVAGEREIVQLP